MNNIPYLLALHSIDGLGPIRLKAILDYFKDPKLAWEAQSVEIRKKLDPISYAKQISDSKIRWLTIFDEHYPKLLKEIYDPPVVIYYKGEINNWNQPAVAVVGSRKMTSSGRLVAEQFAKGLSAAGLTIISGLARGIDSQAHLGAVSQKGKTIAVLGSGLNNIFPPENRQLAAKIADGFGAVISEFSPNSLPMPGNFPLRNRIISGLSLAVLVVEAASGSGSLITARLALEQGREVFAVPCSKGALDLIRDGAISVFHPEQLLEELEISGLVQSIKRGYTA